MKLIITRPRQDAAILLEQLNRLGHNAVSLPLLEIVPRPSVRIPDAKWQAVVFTSANAVRSIADISAIRACPAFVVGPQSAEAARNRGFENVVSQCGGMKALALHLRAVLTPGAGPVLYVSGNVTSGDLAAELEGFSITRLVAYDATPVHTTTSVKQWEGADGVLLYSARSASLWVDATQGKANIMHYCLSHNVARHLPHGARVKVAATPDEDGMLRLLASDSEAA